MGGWVEINERVEGWSPSDEQGEKRGGNRGKRTSRMEHRGPAPRVDAHISPCDVEGPHRMHGMHAAAQPARTEDVHEQVGERECNSGGLLHASKTPEYPLAIVLLHSHAALGRQVRQRVHTRVLAVICARPSCEPQHEWLRVQWPTLWRTGLSGTFLQARLELSRLVTG
jgi:hypothetical protein